MFTPATTSSFVPFEKLAPKANPDHKTENMKINKYIRALAIAGACSSSVSAATLSFNLEQSGGNVTLVVSGSISDLSSWTYSGSGGNPTYIQSGSDSGFMESPGQINVQVIGSPVTNYMWLGTSSGPSTFGTGGQFWETASSEDGYGGLPASAGDSISFSPAGEYSAPWGTTTFNPMLSLPTGYIAGEAINTSATFTGQTFSSLGLTPDSTYSWTYGGDTIEINVGSIPEPSAFVMLSLGAIGLVARRRRVA